jgi:type I restriction enzyme S subunit
MTDQDALPAGWASATLGELCEINPKHVGSQADTQLVSFVPMAAVDERIGAITGAVNRPFGEVRKGYTHFADGDVLFAKITPCMENGKAAVARGLTNGIGCGTTEFFVLRSRGALLPEYLHRFLRQASYRQAARQTMQSGVGQARVPKEFIAGTSIPLPPLAEQHRIVAKLDELLSTSLAARDALNATPALLEQYRRSLLASAFRGDLTADWRRDRDAADQSRVSCEADNRSGNHQDMPALPCAWRYSTLERVAEHGTVVTYGIVLPGPDVPDGVPYVRQQDIEDGRVRLDSLGKTSHTIAAKHQRSALREGDVLLCIIRHLRVAVVPPGIEGANITQGTVRIRPAPFIAADYLATYLSSPAAQQWMKRCYIGMAMPRINVKDARAVPVAVPPIDEQYEIMRRVSEAMQTVQRQLIAVRQMQLDLRTLEEATLQKAFRGELLRHESVGGPSATVPMAPRVARRRHQLADAGPY